jgi:hypothetical protein
MTPASRGKTVAIANSVDFISYLLAGSSSGKIARPAAAPRERERVLNVDPQYDAMPVDADEFRGEAPAPETVISALAPRIVSAGAEKSAPLGRPSRNHLHCRRFRRAAATRTAEPLHDRLMRPYGVATLGLD